MLNKHLGSAKSSQKSRGMHMTWARRTLGMTVSGSLGSSLSRTRLFFRKQIWIFPILAIMALSILAYFVRGSIEKTMKENLHSQLKTLLNVETEMLITWMSVQCSNADSQANDSQVRTKIYDLLKIIDPTNESNISLTATPLQNELRKELNVSMSSHDYVGYFVASKSHVILSASEEAIIGRDDIKEYESMINRAIEGQTIVSPPFPSVSILKDEFGQRRTGIPIMFVCAPIRDENFQIVATLAFQIRPENEFTRIMQLGRIGESGETYAFNRDGLMVSNSRFDHDLILLGLLPDQPNVRSLLNVQIRDPGGNMTDGFRPNKRRSELPLTYMTAKATSGESGENIDGYNDYRGVPVIGAWNWLPDYQLGIATEIDCAEAFEPLIILQWTFWSLYVLLGLCSIAIFVFTIIVARMRREAQKAAIANQKLGQYTLEQKLGEGAMGVVYKGYHAILRRPTAIKMLNLDRVNPQSVERFEREVQITSQLNNPHTIAIYDFGRTEEGVFYYAMEYLDGIDLQTLVDKHGPQPEQRVIKILMQICSSLHEAHSTGLVHRDIKPANIMLNRRGGEADVVKVLDFGLVKAVDDRKQQNLTNSGAMAGTPLYMSPESIQTPGNIDARSDLYAVGAVGYFLLTGTPVFETDNIVELCQMHLSEIPQAPSQRSGKTFSQELEQTLLNCLDKSLSKRPQTARDIILALSRSPMANLWTIEDGELWWSQHDRGMTSSGISKPATPTNSEKTTSAVEQTFIAK